MLPRASQRLKQARALALANLGASSTREIVLDNVIHEHIDRVLDATDNNLSLTADLLGMHRRSLQRMQKRRQKAKRKRRKRR